MIGNKPNVKRGEWIAIGNTDCVVCEIYDESDSYEVEVVYCPDKPANKFSKWVDGKWKFTDTYGGYPVPGGRFSHCLWILKKGKNYKV